MANVLDSKRQVAIISALAEGSGIRQIERMTGVHRDTVMGLGVRTGKGCAWLLDGKMRGLISLWQSTKQADSKPRLMLVGLP